MGNLLNQIGLMSSTIFILCPGNFQRWLSGFAVAGNALHHLGINNNLTSTLALQGMCHGMTLHLQASSLLCGKNMVANVRQKSKRFGFKLSIGKVKGAFKVEHLLCMWKDQTNPCFVATFGCFVTIFIVTKCYALQQEEEEEKRTIQHSREQR
jgi:hypothetical protein